MLLPGSGKLLAQDPHVIDSLTARLQQYDLQKRTTAIVPADTAKVKILIKLVQNHLGSNPAKAFDYATRQLQLSEKLNYKRGIANACVSLGAFYDLKSAYKEALQHYSRALSIYRKIGNAFGEEDCYYNIGSLYGKQSNYTEALKYMLKGLAIATKIKDDFGIGGGYNNLGVLYKSIGNYPEALQAFLKCAAVMQKMQNFSGMATTYNNISVIYLLQGNAEKSISFNRKGIEFSKESGNRQAEGDNYHSIGDAHFKKANYAKALDNYLLALEIRREIGDAYGLAESYTSIGKVYFKQNTYRKATAEVEKGLALAKQSGEQDLMLEAYKSLAEVYDASKNFRLAYNNHVLYKQMTDSLFNAEKDKKFVQLQMQYDFKLERDAVKTLQGRKDLLSKTAINDQKLIRNFLIIVMFVIVFFVAILIWQRNKIAAVRKQKALEAERNRISRELHDNLGAQLSAARIFISSIKNKSVSELSEAVDNSVGLLDASIHDLRGIMEEMNSSVLFNKGYLAATEVLINKLSQLHRIRFSLTSHQMEERLNPRIEHELYRVTQELINNTLKYAAAQNITLDLIRRDGKLVYMYEDDGSGFDLNAVKKGYGLRNIETRIHSVGGSVDFDSTPGSGARTIIEIPL